MWNNTWGGFNQGPSQNDGGGFNPTPWMSPGSFTPAFTGQGPLAQGSGIFPSPFGQGGNMSDLMGILAQILGGGRGRRHMGFPGFPGGMRGNMPTLGTTPMDYLGAGAPATPTPAPTFQAPTG